MTQARLRERMNPKLVRQYLFREALGLVIMAVALFWSAGRLDWWQAWGALGVMTIWTIITALIVLRVNPQLLEERVGVRAGSKKWDEVIMRSMGSISFARYIIAGFDQRNGWSGDFALWLQIAALVACALGYSLFAWAAYVNNFFSRLVRIQTDRGQTVVTAGPYRWVRHPAYFGAIVYEIAVPLLLGSWWVLLISAVTVPILILRTALEDRALRLELPGYADYARRVRYRLLPGIW